MTHRLIVNSRGEGHLVHDETCDPPDPASGRPPRTGEGTLRCEYAQAFMNTRFASYRSGTYEVEINGDGELRVLRVVV